MVEVVRRLTLKKHKLLALVLITSFLILIVFCPIYIGRELDKTSEDILLNSINDTEKVRKIIAWENSLGLSQFESWQEFLRLPNDARWYIFLRKANCGERAIIFEDMAERCKLKYRKVTSDGFIPSGNNHRWTEVWLDDDWRIADSGFNLCHPENNQSYFTSEGFLIGHVEAINDDKTIDDCTDSYVNRTGKLIIKGMKDNETIEDANVKIYMGHKSHTCMVVGNNLIKSTNKSGFFEINLGIYNDSYYNVSVSTSRFLPKYCGENSVTINNNTNFLVVELKKNINRTRVLVGLSVALIFYVYFILIEYIYIKVIKRKVK